jgi:hypothetical protein
MKKHLTHIAAAAAGAVLALPGSALATHVFEDVDDDRFYAEPIEWAAERGITNGTSPTTFSPLDPVTRGESVTFLKRYHDSTIVPYASGPTFDGNADLVIMNGTTPSVSSLEVFVPEGQQARAMVTFTGSSYCHNGDGVLNFCVLDIVVDGESMFGANKADWYKFDSTDGGAESNQSSEGHAMALPTGPLGPGLHTFDVIASTTHPDTVFRIEDFTTQIHLMPML